MNLHESDKPPPVERGPLLRTHFGRRVRLISHTDPYVINLEPGALGTAGLINHYDLGDGPGSTLFVNWDNGSRLGLIEGVDKWEYVD